MFPLTPRRRRWYSVPRQSPSFRPVGRTTAAQSLVNGDCPVADEKSDEEMLRKVASFRLSERDYDIYRAKVVASGLKQSEFFRRHVLTNTTQVVAAKRASLDAKKMLYLVGTVSNNINQLAHRANTDHLAGKNSESTYAAILSNLETINSHLVKVLRNVD